MKNVSRFFLLIFAVILIFLIAPRLGKRVLQRTYPQAYQAEVAQAADIFSLDEALINAVIWTESKFDPEARSSADAMGLMQLTAETYEWITQKQPELHPRTGSIWTPENNILAGSALLRFLMDQYGSLEVALCAYNAGMGNVSDWLSDPDCSPDGVSLSVIPFPETESYVQQVKDALSTYQ